MEGGRERRKRKEVEERDRGGRPRTEVGRRGRGWRVRGRGGSSNMVRRGEA